LGRVFQCLLKTNADPQRMNDALQGLAQLTGEQKAPSLFPLFF